jgi:hypothetical protein
MRLSADIRGLLIAEFGEGRLGELNSQTFGDFLGQLRVGGTTEKFNIRHSGCSRGKVSRKKDGGISRISHETSSSD